MSLCCGYIKILPGILWRLGWKMELNWRTQITIHSWFQPSIGSSPKAFAGSRQTSMKYGATTPRDPILTDQDCNSLRVAALLIVSASHEYSQSGIRSLIGSCEKSMTHQEEFQSSQLSWHGAIACPNWQNLTGAVLFPACSSAPTIDHLP
jgi:hypothetical protein